MRSFRLLRSFAVVGATLVLALASGPMALADGPTVTGAGSTWVAIALEQWRADAARFGLSINYQGVGSTAGREFFIIGQTDFAASEIPFESSELQQLQAENKSFQYLPDVAGGTALMYNLKDQAGNRITNLGLSAATAAGIFTGKIQWWDDPAIVRENGGRWMPHTQIVPVVRADGSGTSAKLADYFFHEAPAIFKPFMAANHVSLPMSFWPSTVPHSVAQRSSDGVANFVASDAVGANSIGYVEAGYALYRRFPVVGILNAAGKYALPSSTNVATALKHATLNADRTQNLIGVYHAPEAAAYPLASYSYLITQTTGFDPAKGAVLGAWIEYIACAGQKSAAPLGYSPLPPNLVSVVFDAVKRIPGAPTPPPLSQCGNPTITGAGFSGGGFANFVTVGGAGAVGGGGTGGTATGGAGSGTTGTGSGGGAGTGGIPGAGGPTVPGASASASGVASLSPAEQGQRFQQALQAVGAASTTPGIMPGTLGAIGLAVAVLVPAAIYEVVVRRRRGGRRRRAAEPSAPPGGSP